MYNLFGSQINKKSLEQENEGKTKAFDEKVLYDIKIIWKRNMLNYSILFPTLQEISYYIISKVSRWDIYLSPNTNIYVLHSLYQLVFGDSCARLFTEQSESFYIM